MRTYTPSSSVAACRISSFQVDKKFIAYEWRGVLNLTSDQVSHSIQVASALGVNEIYLDISDYIAIEESLDKSTKIGEKNEYIKKLESYLLKANDKHIRVSVLAGGPKWHQPEYAYLTDMVVDFVSSFNARPYMAVRIVGIELDVEPYVSGDFKGNETESVQKLVEYIDTVSGELEKQNESKEERINVGFSVPFWLDTITITYNDQTLPAIEKILSIANRDNSTITIMAYRNQLNGEDGVIANVDSELTYAEKLNANDILVIGQEVGDVEPAKTTYFSKGLGYTLSNIEKIYGHFESNNAFLGVAVNDLQSFVLAYDSSTCER